MTYDICDTKRLAKLARMLEKLAMRVQYSVFLLCSVSQNELLDIIDKINDIIDNEADDVRIYMIIDSGIALGRALNLDEPYIFLDERFV